jgi:hypothetical protein
VKPGCRRESGMANVTLTNDRNTDALDGVLGAEHFIVPPIVSPGLLEILDFPARF